MRKRPRPTRRTSSSWGSGRTKPASSRSTPPPTRTHSRPWSGGCGGRPLPRYPPHGPLRPGGATAGGFRPMAALARVTAAQREVAQELGAAFLDLRDAMEGPGSVRRWVLSTPSLAQPDHVHFTSAGYELLARLVAGELAPGLETQRRALAVTSPESMRASPRGARSSFPTRCRRSPGPAERLLSSSPNGRPREPREGSAPARRSGPPRRTEPRNGSVPHPRARPGRNRQAMRRPSRVAAGRAVADAPVPGDEAAVP